MAKNYEVGKSYYMPVTVKEGFGTDYKYPVFLEFVDCKGRDTADTVCIADEPDLLLTDKEIAEYIHYRRNREKDNRIEEMSGEIKTLKSENERLSRQNEELGVKVDDLETELENVRSVNEFAVKTEQTSKKIIEEQRGLIKKYSMVIDILLDKIAELKKGENNG